MDRSKLAGLAALVAIVGGGSVTVWQSLPDTTLADLQDAGIGSCPTRGVACNFRIDDDGRNVLADAGLNLARGYVTLQARVKVCQIEDGGRDVVFPPFPQRAGQLAALSTPDPHNCTIGADPGPPMWRVAPSPCVRRPSGGTLAGCHRRDGGDQGELNAAPRTELAGAQCEDTACVVFAGETP